MAHYSRPNRDPRAKNLDILPPLHIPVKKVPSPKKITIPVESLLFGEPRTCRPSRILVIIRGLPGSGKSSLAQLIKLKETEINRLEGVQPSCRVLSIDDYFVIESEDKPGQLVYEYDAELEQKYMAQLLKTVRLQMENAHFPFLIAEAPFSKDSDLAFLNRESAQRDYQVGKPLFPIISSLAFSH
ncbi:Ylpm1p [Cichlidogyrus casuarinus]|uniref:Ylpm1p n=1 Tax=Cichlidogyrus casuarinus TaxID=1844966 RepID=A0ABD2PLH5_9PLAT